MRTSNIEICQSTSLYSIDADFDDGDSSIKDNDNSKAPEWLYRIMLYSVKSISTTRRNCPACAYVSLCRLQTNSRTRSWILY
mmetsp:Transcript_33954/g.34453  ORF Transcript_33954/g.34453 Transcript_33954/m.34453 type:complete len:82 (+) Transcript_33954:121-366(+)